MKLIRIVVTVVMSIFILQYNIQAQDIVNISGKIIDSTSTISVENVTLSVYQKDKIIFSTLSNEDGTFNIRLNKDVDSFSVYFKHINYFLKTVPFVVQKRSNFNLGIINLAQKSISLQEVNITSKNRISLKKNRDTLTADFSNFEFNRSVMTNKALESIPGIKVINSKVYFNGEEIEDVQVGDRNFIFDQKFMLQNLPGFTISKVKIINKKDGSGNVRKRINIILKDENQSAYLFDNNLSKGTSSSNWGSVSSAKIDRLYQIGLRMQHNNINLFSDAWDSESLSNSTNIQGLHKLTTIDLSGLYIIDKKNTIDLKYRNNKQISEVKQTTSIVNVTSSGETESEIENNNNTKNNFHHLNISLKKDIDSLTVMKIGGEAKIINNNSENSSIFKIEDQNITSNSTKNFKGNETSIFLNIDRMKKSDKSNFYDFQLLTGKNKGNNDDYISTNLTDSATNTKLENEYIEANYKIKFSLSKISTLELYSKNNYKKFASVDDLERTNNSQVSSFQSYLGFRLALTEGTEQFSLNLSHMNYSLRSNLENAFHIKGVSSSINYNNILNNSNSISLAFSNEYLLPSIGQITGIPNLGEQPVLNMKSNFELKPEQIFNFSVKYGIKNGISVNLKTYYANNKIENILITSPSKFPEIQYINSKAAKSVALNVGYSKSILQDKMQIGGTIGSKYSESNYLSNNLSIPNNMLSSYLSILYKFNPSKILTLEYSGEFSNYHYFNISQLKNTIISNNVITKHELGDRYEFSSQFRFVNYLNNLNSTTNANIINFITSYKLLKSKSIKTFISINNILNSDNGQLITSSIDRVQYFKINSLGRYFLFGLNYKISTFK